MLKKCVEIIKLFLIICLRNKNRDKRNFPVEIKKDPNVSASKFQYISATVYKLELNWCVNNENSFVFLETLFPCDIDVQADIS